MPNGNAAKRILATWSSALLGGGERLVPNYCADVAGCSCPSTHNFASVPCKPVARTGGGNRSGPYSRRLPGVDRCLECGARWERRDYRTDPLVLLPSEVKHDAA